MKAEGKIQNGKGYISFFDETGKHASFTVETNELNFVKLKAHAKKEEKRITDLYAAYEAVTKLLLNKPIKADNG